MTLTSLVPISVIKPRNVPSKTDVAPVLTFDTTTVFAGTSILNPFPTLIPIPVDPLEPKANVPLNADVLTLF